MHPAADDLLIPVHYRVGGGAEFRLSTIATIGAANDITLEELRLESFSAADAATEQLVRSGFF